MHKGYCIKIANFVHPLQVGVARFKAIDVRVASGFRSQVKTRSNDCNFLRKRGRSLAPELE